MIKQKKTKKKNVNVSQTVVVNIQKGKRNPRAKASAPQAMSAPQIIQPQVGSAYHQAVYGARAPAIPSMGNVPGYYAGMMSPFNAPLHIASEVQQAQLRQANELAGANVVRPSTLKGLGSTEPGSTDGLRSASMGVSQQSANAPIYNLDKQEAKPMTVPLSLLPSKPFAPTLPMEAPEPASASSSSSMISPEEKAAVAAPSINYDELLEEIDNSVGAEGNKKREPGQYTKAELIQMVTSVTGRTFSPSMSNSYNTIKQYAISFIKAIRGSK